MRFTTEELAKEMVRLMNLKKDLKSLYKEAERELKEVQKYISTFDDNTSRDVINSANNQKRSFETVLDYFDGKVKEVETELEEVSKEIKTKK